MTSGLRASTTKLARNQTPPPRNRPKDTEPVAPRGPRESPHSQVSLATELAGLEPATQFRAGSDPGCPATGRPGIFIAHRGHGLRPDGAPQCLLEYQSLSASSRRAAGAPRPCLRVGELQRNGNEVVQKPARYPRVREQADRGGAGRSPVLSWAASLADAQHVPRAGARHARRILRSLAVR
jgi:hypothetical protein